MLLKTTIFIVIALILLSLVSSLFFLLKDQGLTESKRTVYGLGARVSLGIYINNFNYLWSLYRAAR